MDDIVWFACYTSSGLPQTLKMDAEIFEIALDSALRKFKLENKTD